MTRLIRKAITLAKRGDLRVLANVTFKRLVHRRWRVRLFAESDAVGASAAVWPEGYRFEMWPAAHAIPRSAASALLTRGVADLWADLDSGDHLYVVWADDRIASFGAVFARSPQRVVLGLPQDARIIGSCETLAEFRGRGLYRTALNETVRCLRQLGAGPTFVEVKEDNQASIRGVLGAGFSDMGVVDASIFLGTFVLRGKRVYVIDRSVTR
jgi:hypothetical protein